ncbi:flagellar motor switch protein FliM [Clostridium cellulovorans]|uniref:Flagellar motor switch protein FliM n=1 Tax=Clostridium cellulovorans (strain ATCC 35296 / DSM 3052 / OCM 3 / 743B) TaxID=573061 RepID=D9SKE5_CLOC7|nr:flagellar motor switch protein FliM [Clostridium cellulovorans]ADL51441.1 flagellar motor switch protein FliM [Clostridium cellulovorans 743B]
MAEVLSQSEIDALLSALNSGEIQPDELQKVEDKQKVKLYDFRSPQKFSKDHIRTLELIHDNYARIISSYLTAQVRSNVKVKIESVEQTTYEEFIHSIQNPTILTVFKMPPLAGNILFETNPQFVYQIIDILLGGTGEGKYKNREFTDIDKNIITRINEGLISNLKLAWSEVLEVNPEIETIETNPALNQTLAPHEPVALIIFTIEIGESRTYINICIPFICIEKYLDHLEIKHWYHDSSDEEDEVTKEYLRMKLDSVQLVSEVILGNASVTVEDFLNLTVGDVVTLERKFEDPLEVVIEERPHFLAKPGIIGKKTGVQIIDIIDKDVDKNE